MCFDSTMRCAMMERMRLSGTSSPGTIAGSRLVRASQLLSAGGAAGAAETGAGAAAAAGFPRCGEHIFLGDASTRAGSRHLAQVEIVLLGDLAHQRRGATRRRREALRPARGSRRGSWRGWFGGRGPAQLRQREPRRLPSADDGDDGVDLNRGASVDLDLGQHAGGRRRNFGIDLVGGDFEEWLVRSTVSPTFLSHLVMVPSKMDSPICGITTSMAWLETAGAAGAEAGAGDSDAASSQNCQGEQSGPQQGQGHRLCRSHHEGRCISRRSRRIAPLPYGAPTAPPCSPAAPKPAPSSSSSRPRRIGSAQPHAFNHRPAHGRVEAHQPTRAYLLQDRPDANRQAARKEKTKYEQRNGVKLTYLPFITREVINTLRKMPIVNATMEGDGIRYHKNVNIGIAVALDWGLIVPVIKEAEDKSFLGIARAIVDLAERARGKKLKPEEVGAGHLRSRIPESLENSLVRRSSTSRRARSWRWRLFKDRP